MNVSKKNEVNCTPQYLMSLKAHLKGKVFSYFEHKLEFNLVTTNELLTFRRDGSWMKFCHGIFILTRRLQCYSGFLLSGLSCV